MPTSAKRKANHGSKCTERRRAARKRAAEFKIKEANRITFFSLPSELRNKIYLMALPWESRVFRFSVGVHAVVPGILQVNKQTRAETLGYFYGETDFDLIIHHKHFLPVRVWAESLCKEAKAHLLKNQGVNLRIVFDKFHNQYDAIEKFLKNHEYALWYAIAEPSNSERERIYWMKNIVREREEHSLSRLSDNEYTYGLQRREGKRLGISDGAFSSARDYSLLLGVGSY